jgi:ABC-type branched-subunit amino acid transport system ATPase component
LSFVEIDGLCAGYGRARVLRDVTMTIEEGESLALVGRNGAGKTTLLMSLFGFTSIYAGDIVIGGRRIPKTARMHAPRLGLSIAPQGRLILPNLSVRENLLLGAAARRPGPWSLDTVCALFPILKERADTPGTTLSGGQQQMLAIGRALMANPSILVLDEPSEGLSPLIIDEIVRVLKDIRCAGTGLLIVEQHLSLVKRVAQRFEVLSKGQIVAGGPIDAIDLPENRTIMAL